MRARLWLSESFTFTWQSTMHRLILKYTVCVWPLTPALFTIFILFWVIINKSGGRLVDYLSYFVDICLMEKADL